MSAPKFLAADQVPPNKAPGLEARPSYPARHCVSPTSPCPSMSQHSHLPQSKSNISRLWSLFSSRRSQGGAKGLRTNIEVIRTELPQVVGLPASPSGSDTSERSTHMRSLEVEVLKPRTLPRGRSVACENYEKRALPMESPPSRLVYSPVSNDSGVQTSENHPHFSHRVSTSPVVDTNQPCVLTNTIVVSLLTACCISQVPAQQFLCVG